jgi:hypothetical protein
MTISTDVYKRRSKIFRNIFIYGECAIPALRTSKKQLTSFLYVSVSTLISTKRISRKPNATFYWAILRRVSAV